MSTKVRLGLLRLADSAPVLVAAERGLFETFGLSVALSVEPSWSNIADKLAYGLLDGAVMLPPLALACGLGVRGRRTDLIVPLGLSVGGNTLVLAGLEPADGMPNVAPSARLAAFHEPFAQAAPSNGSNRKIATWLSTAGLPWVVLAMKSCATLLASESENQSPKVYISGRSAILPSSCRLRPRAC